HVERRILRHPAVQVALRAVRVVLQAGRPLLLGGQEACRTRRRQVQVQVEHQVVAHVVLLGALLRDTDGLSDRGALREQHQELLGRVVQLSGNTTLSIIAGMLHEITVRHTAFALEGERTLSKPDYDKLMKSYWRLMKLVRAGDGAAAEAHWRTHLDNARRLMLEGLENVRVRDVMG